jgi:hypothetical protein
VNKFSSVNKPVVIEIVNREGTVDEQRLMAIFNAGHDPAINVYKWNNHFVFFGAVDTNMVKTKVQSQYPGASMRVYSDMVYVYDRSVCKDRHVEPEWDNVILTANLANDPTLQQEYLDYHSTQFEKWPEVAKGFCTAGFQQLIVYKNGRQLMLVISIPKGSSLDDLNPKTTENNPSIVEWNNLMKKYQEGIESTSPGEVWVIFKPIK